MAKRPALTEDSFLLHLFAPKKNALPTGIRKRAIAFTPGRTKGRVAAYNRMSGSSQEILRRSGLRDAYLKGTVRLTDARKALRDTAVSKGLAKPLRPRKGKAPAGPSLDGLVAMHVARTLAQNSYPVGPKFYQRVGYLPEELKPSVLNWSLSQIRAYAGEDNPARDADDELVIIDGQPFNPLWYH